MAIGSLIASRLARSSHAAQGLASAISQSPTIQSNPSPLLSRLGAVARAFSSKPEGPDAIGVDLGTRNSSASAMEGKAIENGEGTRVPKAEDVVCQPFSYILASHHLEAGSMVINCNSSKPYKGGFLPPAQSSQLSAASPLSPAYRNEILELNSKPGNSIPLADIRMGTWVHDIECRPGQGAKLARSAGTCAKIIKELGSQCLVRLPSGVEKLIDSRCRATIGVVSNVNHGARRLRKAGHSRWLGRRPIVRGVAMNPVDHPHGGGEGRTKGGRPSVSPWGKPTKSGYRSVRGKRKQKI